MRAGAYQGDVIAALLGITIAQVAVAIDAKNAEAGK